jgi:hypothetical protein
LNFAFVDIALECIGEIAVAAVVAPAYFGWLLGVSQMIVDFSIQD